MTDAATILTLGVSAGTMLIGIGVFGCLTARDAVRKTASAGCIGQGFIMALATAAVYASSDETFALALVVAVLLPFAAYVLRDTSAVTPVSETEFPPVEAVTAGQPPETMSPIRGDS